MWLSAELTFRCHTYTVHSDFSTADRDALANCYRDACAADRNANVNRDPYAADRYRDPRTTDGDASAGNGYRVRLRLRLYHHPGCPQ